MIEYTGHDLIFATGAPGSKWSRILSTLGLHPSINNSDKDKFPRYNLNVKFANGTIMPVGNHSGAYFGPYNTIGEKFNDLTKLSKEEFVEEIKRPFDNWDQRLKIIKSHWFSYDKNLDWLLENFPDAKIILVYNGDEAAFKWWHFVGGWDISFPTYTWYVDDQRMYEKILEENRCILNFARKHLIPVKMYKDFQEILRELELSDDLDFINHVSKADTSLVNRLAISKIGLIEQFNDSVNGAALGVLSKKSVKSLDLTECNNYIKKSNELSIQRHTRFQVDKLLAVRHSENWIYQINKIVESGAAKYTEGEFNEN